MRPLCSIGYAGPVVRSGRGRHPQIRRGFGGLDLQGEQSSRVAVSDSFSAARSSTAGSASAAVCSLSDATAYSLKLKRPVLEGGRDGRRGGVAVVWWRSGGAAWCGAAAVLAPAGDGGVDP
jgi:hypothetical protein